MFSLKSNFLGITQRRDRQDRVEGSKSRRTMPLLAFQVAEDRSNSIAPLENTSSLLWFAVVVNRKADWRKLAPRKLPEAVKPIYIVSRTKDDTLAPFSRL